MDKARNLLLQAFRQKRTVSYDNKPLFEVSKKEHRKQTPSINMIMKLEKNDPVELPKYKPSTTSKDWTGNYNSIFKTLGATSHSNEVREENDFYATTPEAAEYLLELETFSDNIWECACGSGHLSEVFIKNGYTVTSTDLIDRGYGISGIDFLRTVEVFYGDIITNPPYKYAKEFVEKALDVIPEGNKVAMFLKLTFLESKSRRQFFTENPPKYIYVSSSRLTCAKNGDFEAMKKAGGSAIAYGWFIWEKGFNGESTLRWFN